MGLSQDIVIKHKFSIKGTSSRMGPRYYVMSYIVKEAGAERMAPVMRYDDQDGLMQLYANRADVVDNAMLKYLDVSGFDKFKKDLYHLQADGGVAFDNNSISISQQGLLRDAAQIQKHFDSGKTVFFTVISFAEDYLKKHGVLPESLHAVAPGDLRGNIDQLKVRTAIRSALDCLSEDYDDLQYVAAMHVDQKHAHCHIVMVDRGRGEVMSDGTQRGKLHSRQMDMIRSTINNSLIEYENIYVLSPMFDRDRRNVQCYLKQYSTHMIANRGELQFILACLPDDRSLWQASSSRYDMQRANNLTRDYVQDLFKRDDTGYSEAFSRVKSYADSRMRQENLSDEEYDALLNAGRERITMEAMNSVYSVLRNVDSRDFYASTPFMSVMTSDQSDLLSGLGRGDQVDDMVEFGYRFRTYQSRLDHHRKEKHKYHDAAKDYMKETDEGRYDEKSRVLYDFFKEEEEYNDMLIFKYHTLLPLNIERDEYEQLISDYNEYAARVNNMDKMGSDEAFVRMRADNAERYGLNVYGEAGGSLLVTDRPAFSERLSLMHDKLLSDREHVDIMLSDYGMIYDPSSGMAVRRSDFSFKDVRALDLHVLGYDFSSDIPVEKDDIDKFVTVTNRRYTCFVMAKDYLEKTGQLEAVKNFPVNDIESQKEAASYFDSSDVLPTRRSAEAVPVKEVRTLPLDYSVYARQELTIRQTVRDNINSLQY